MTWEMVDYEIVIISTEDNRCSHWRLEFTIWKKISIVWGDPGPSMIGWQPPSIKIIKVYTYLYTIIRPYITNLLAPPCRLISDFLCGLEVPIVLVINGLMSAWSSGFYGPMIGNIRTVLLKTRTSCYSIRTINCLNMTSNGDCN